MVMDLFYAHHSIPNSFLKINWLEVLENFEIRHYMMTPLWHNKGVTWLCVSANATNEQSAHSAQPKKHTMGSISVLNMFIFQA